MQLSTDRRAASSRLVTCAWLFGGVCAVAGAALCHYVRDVLKQGLQRLGVQPQPMPLTATGPLSATEPLPATSVPGMALSTSSDSAWRWRASDSNKVCGFAIPVASNETYKLRPIWSSLASRQKRERKHVTELKQPFIFGKPTSQLLGTRILVWQCLRGELCGGWGDQIRGITSALYIALVTSRAFFIQWDRLNASVSRLLRPGAIDWTWPAHVDLKTLRCRRLNLHEIGYYSTIKGFSDYAKGFSGIESIRDRPEIVWQGVKGAAPTQDPCIIIAGNAAPTSLWANTYKSKQAYSRLPSGVQNQVSSLRSNVGQKHNLGCAMNFLFDLPQSYSNNMQQHSFLPSSLKELPPNIIGVHLRFGDVFMMGGGDKNRSEVVDRAVSCANSLGRDLFGQVRPGQPKPWWIFLASDSNATKAYALGLEGEQIFVNSALPIHSEDKKSPRVQGLSKLLDSLLDHIVLARANGFVGCAFGCRHSSYSEISIQESLLPVQNVRTISKGGCVRRQVRI